MHARLDLGVQAALLVRKLGAIKGTASGCTAGKQGRKAYT